ncbi:MAG: hypothetical protein HKN76_19670 [Saprospiraceae bacterium]|nr:hypothetical protein [Saprospiraceae bacterium]
MNKSLVGWILRLGVFGTFLGHGIFALMHKPAWLHFITFWGIPEEVAWKMMTAIGVIDLLIALITIVRPIGIVLLYATCWAFAAALMRPVSGGYFLDFIERSANWAAPLALYFWMQYMKQNEN